MIVKTMYFDAPAPAYTGKATPVEGALLVVTAAAISPLGWVLLMPLTFWTDQAAKALF